jgi:A/G-specific adenine glycosylase
LYEPPLLESKEKITKKLFQKSFCSSFKVLSIKNIELLKKVSHKLSHQNLEINFWKVNILKLQKVKGPSLLKANFKSVLNYPFPKPISKYLNEYLNR